MSVKEFKSTQAALLGQRSIQIGNLADHEGESRIQGHYGWVRQMDDGRLYVAMTYTGCVRLKEACPEYKGPLTNGRFVMKRGEECFTYTGAEKLPLILKAIKQIRDRPAQARKANGWARE